MIEVLLAAAAGYYGWLIFLGVCTLVAAIFIPFGSGRGAERRRQFEERLPKP